MVFTKNDKQSTSILGVDQSSPGSLRLEFASKNFQTEDGQEVQALKSVNLTVAPGEFVAIMGFSGSGKSTLLNILGLLDSPSAGKYFVGDQDTTSLSQVKRARLRRDRFGFIFQDFNLLNRYTVEQNIIMGLAYQSVNRETSKNLARSLLNQLGLLDKALVYPNHLSGGQAQRIAIARALINNPPVILADEPTGNLDSIATAEIVQLLKSLKEKGTTIVMVTHSKSVAASADRVVNMKSGQITHEGLAV